MRKTSLALAVAASTLGLSLSQAAFADFIGDINPAIKYTKSCRVGDTWMPEIRTDSLGV